MDIWVKIYKDHVPNPSALDPLCMDSDLNHFILDCWGFKSHFIWNRILGSGFLSNPKISSMKDFS